MYLNISLFTPVIEVHLFKEMPQKKCSNVQLPLGRSKGDVPFYWRNLTDDIWNGS